MVILDRFLWCHLKCIVLVYFLGSVDARTWRGYRLYGPRMGPIVSFSLVRGSWIVPHSSAVWDSTTCSFWVSMVGRRTMCPAMWYSALPPRHIFLSLQLFVEFHREWWGFHMWPVASLLPSSLSFLSFPLFLFPGAHPLKPARSLGSAEHGRQTVSVHPKVKIAMKWPEYTSCVV